MSDNLVVRLRGLAVALKKRRYPENADLAHECAAELDRLRAENERLRTWHGAEVVLCIDGNPACDDCMCAGGCLNVRPNAEVSGGRSPSA